MDTTSIIAELEAERDKLDQAIAALQGSRKARGMGKARAAATNSKKRPTSPFSSSP